MNLLLAMAKLLADGFLELSSGMGKEWVFGKVHVKVWADEMPKEMGWETEASWNLEYENDTVVA